MNVLDDTAVANSISRVLRQDIHASSRVSLSGGNLQVQEDNGVSYTYFTNDRHQLIRYQAGGGVAVIAADVARFAPLIQNSMIHLAFCFIDGVTYQISIESGE